MKEFVGHLYANANTIDYVVSGAGVLAFTGLSSNPSMVIGAAGLIWWAHVGTKFATENGFISSEWQTVIDETFNSLALQLALNTLSGITVGGIVMPKSMKEPGGILWNAGKLAFGFNLFSFVDKVIKQASMPYAVEKDFGYEALHFPAKQFIAQSAKSLFASLSTDVGGKWGAALAGVGGAVGNVVRASLTEKHYARFNDEYNQKLATHSVITDANKIIAQQLNAQKCLAPEDKKAITTALDKAFKGKQKDCANIKDVNPQVLAGTLYAKFYKEFKGPIDFSILKFQPFIKEIIIDAIQYNKQKLSGEFGKDAIRDVINDGAVGAFITIVKKYGTDTVQMLGSTSCVNAMVMRGSEAAIKQFLLPKIEPLETKLYSMSRIEPVPILGDDYTCLIKDSTEVVALPAHDEL